MPRAAARHAVVRGAARNGVIQIGRIEHDDRLEPFCREPQFRTATIRSWSAAAFMTPPLNSTCVGHARPLRPRRTGARAAAASTPAATGSVRGDCVTAGSAGIRQPELLQTQRAAGGRASRRAAPPGRIPRAAPGSRRRATAGW